MARQLIRWWSWIVLLAIISLDHIEARAQLKEQPHTNNPKETRHWDPEFSFGHTLPISDDGRKIPHYEVIGVPQILRDRVVLTPPAPGNQRSAIWSEHSNHNEEWELDVPFRASGPERAGGSFHIWYTFRGASATGTSTVYTAKPFEGLALVVDSFGGHGGSVRGFLNDGTIDYSIHHHPQSLAFGHCDVSYRNLGKLTKLRIIYSPQNGLRVTVDDNTCFESNKITLPKNYRFGVSAASADTPDSFEIFGFKVGVHELFSRAAQVEKNDPDHHQRKQAESRERRLASSDDHQKAQNIKFELEDSDAKAYKTTDAQFKDLHERMQAMTHQVAEVQRVAGEMTNTLESFINDVRGFMDRSGSGSGDSDHRLDSISERISSIDRQLLNFEKTLKHDSYNLHSSLKDHHENLKGAIPGHIQEALTTHGPRMGFGISMLIVFQVMLVIAYVMYKRRRAIAPKKYL